MKLARYTTLVDRNGVVSYRYNPPADAIEAGVVKRESLGTSLVEAINKANQYNEVLDNWRKEHRYLKHLTTKSTVLDLVKSYINSIDYTKLSAKSKEDYVYYLKRWAGDKASHTTLYATRLQDLTTPSIQRIYDLHAAHSVSLANHVLAVYRLLFSYAIRNGFTTFNPFTAVKKQSSKPRRVTWERDDIKAFMAAAFSKFETRSLGLLVYTAYCAAQRLGDMRLLTWDSYDVDTGVLSLTQSKRRAKVSIPLPQDLQQMLKQQHSELGWQQYVFPTTRTVAGVLQPYSLQGLAKAGRVIMDDAQLPDDLQLMDLRRTAVTEMVMAGVPLTNVMSLTGHATPSSLTPYVRHTLKAATVAQDMRDLRPMFN
jgi:integrase